MSDTVSILEGNTFVVSDRVGDFDASPAETSGLFMDDTRFLSRWVLTINGARPKMLSTDDVNYFSAQFFSTLSSGTIYVDSDISVIRKRAVGNGFHEDLTIANHSFEPKTLDVRIEVDSDFADLFEVKDALKQKVGRLYERIEDGRLVLGYERDRFVRETWITSSQAPTSVDEHGFSFALRIDGHASWSTSLDVELGRSLRSAALKYHSADDEPTPDVGMSMHEWLAKAPQLRSSWRSLERTYERSLIDLAALRFYSPFSPGGALPAAGLPWFMAVFGRDAIITSLQAIPFVPEMAATTLKVLAARQGTCVDFFRDEEPGKILHESRLGELTAFEERPHSPYFGSADSTPLWLVLLDEYERWSGDRALVQRLRPNALAALEWIDRFGDRDGDGYVEYERRMESGLENQCWKDSWDSIQFRDGRLADLPRATCEIQGYVYDAKVRAARLAREIWMMPELADRLEREAADLKTRFNQDFWIEDRQFFALALDGHKRPVDSLTSNIGHLLWSGIVNEEHTEPTVRHLVGPELFSGWGVRTMGASEGGFNPIGYHVGTVWPHDTSIVAAGLRLYGYKREATTIAMGILESADYFNHRLPEAFAGYERAATQFPVEYPTACSPQAWATGAPLLLLRVILGMQPVGNALLVAPSIPTDIERIELTGIPGRWGLADAFGRGTLEPSTPHSPVSV
jgi:glycogen debranching enzyme